MLGKLRGELVFGKFRGALEFGKFRGVFIPELPREAIFGLLPPPKFVGGRGTDRWAFPNDGCELPKDGVLCVGPEEKPPRGCPVLPPIGGRGTLRAICVLSEPGRPIWLLPIDGRCGVPPIGRATSRLPIWLFMGARAIPFPAPTRPAKGLFAAPAGPWLKPRDAGD